MPLFGEALVLIGILLVLFGMVSTARLFREEYLGPVPAVMKGFVPITAGGPAQGSAPPLVSRPHISTRSSLALVRPAERQQRAPVDAPPPAASQLSTETSQPLSPPLAVNDGLRLFMPLVEAHQEDQSALAQPDTATTTAAVDTATAAGAPEVAAQPTPDLPAFPDWIDIPVIGLEAPVVEVQAVPVRISGQSLQQWSAPNTFAAGWHANSAMLGQPGNTVINGHHNIFGSVFARLRDLQPGDQIILWSDERVFFYEIEQILLLEERFAELATRQENARWILPSDDERLTLVTCWPPESNTHRLMVLARPIVN